MKLLILGGTVFVGRSLAERALEAGHEVTLFTRGLHGAGLFPGAEMLRGDRDGGLAALEGRTWDAVVDTCGYVPRIVGLSARLLAGSAGHYTFISSVSVYADFRVSGAGEDYPTGVLADPSVEKVDGETYGPLKALCERVVMREFAGRSLVIRPGLIVGPHDPTDRFTWWPVRVARGGRILAPGDPGHPVQFIDVRDLAAWTLRMIERRAAGVYNAVGPWPAVSMGELVDCCRKVSGASAEINWVPEAFLLANGVAPWSELPLWVATEEESAGFHTTSAARALESGLTTRPIAETVRDTLEWFAALPPRAMKAGLQETKEAEILRRWDARGDPA